MEIVKTTGISLSSRVTGEADIVCNFFTRDHGKRKFVFKGLKKSKKRSRAATEPGALSTLVYYYRENQESCIVNDVSVEKYYSSITGDLTKIFHLYFILESVDRTCGYNITDESIFTLLSAGIEVLSKTEYPAHLSAFIILHLLQSHGILSEMHACKLCGATDFSGFSLDIVDLRPVCASCIKNDQARTLQRSALLSRSMGSYMDMCLSGKFDKIDHGAFETADVLDLLFAVALFMEHYFHMEIKSKSFIFSERFS